MSGLPVNRRARARELSGRLECLLPLKEAQQILLAAHDELGSDFVSLREAKSLREAWVGIRYAVACDHSHISCSDAPDLKIGSSAQTLPWEVVEALEVGRTRSLEYQFPSATATRDNFEARAALFGPSISNAVGRKALKRYSRDTGLIIYANLGLYGWYRRQFEPQLHSLTLPVSEAYSEVALLWEGRMYRLWKSGEPLDVDPVSYDVLLSHN